MERTKERTKGRTLRLAAVGLFASVILPATGRASAPTAPSLEVVGCTLEIDGDSTLHKFSASSHACWAEFTIDETGAVLPSPTDLTTLIRAGDIKTFSLTVPVVTLKSGDSHLDDHMWKALKESRFKQIGFEMDSYRLLPPAAAGDAFTLAMRGRLRIAGVSRPIDLTARVKARPGGLEISGSKTLLMTDYQVSPPVLFLGTLKTANLITIKFGAELRATAH